LIFFWR